MVDAVILTIRKDEHEAVVRRLETVRPERRSRQYTIGGVRRTDGRLAHVAVMRLVEQGTGPAQDAARDAIQDFDPRLLCVVGIGGAVPGSDLSLGDVLVATRLADLRVQALRHGAEPQIEARGERVHKGLADAVVNLLPSVIDGWASAESIGMAAPDVSLDDDRFEGPEPYRRKVRDSLARAFAVPRRPVFGTGTVGSSDMLVRDPDAVARWHEVLRKLEVFEMEAAGVFEAAARPDRAYPVLIVRGISDVIGYRREGGWTAYACETAAALAIALLRSGQLDPFGP